MMQPPLDGDEAPPVTFTRAGLAAGLRQMVPLAIGIFTYGLVFGVLSRQVGLSLLESLLMSSLVFAGSAQFVALGLWTAPLPVLQIVFTTLVVNLRHLLMGAAVYPWLSRVPAPLAFTSVFFMTDESWALTMRRLAGGYRDIAFLLGSGIMTFVAWVGSTLAGRALGGVIQDPTQWGLDFAFTAIFLALLAGFWRVKSDLLPWLVALGVVVAALRYRGQGSGVRDQGSGAGEVGPDGA